MYFYSLESAIGIIPMFLYNLVCIETQPHVITLVFHQLMPLKQTNQTMSKMQSLQVTPLEMEPCICVHVQYIKLVLCCLSQLSKYSQYMMTNHVTTSMH